MSFCDCLHPSNRHVRLQMFCLHVVSKWGMRLVFQYIRSDKYGYEANK